MDGVAPARTRQQPVGDHAAAPRLAIVLPGRGGRGCADRVEAPNRVLRIWSLLNNAEEELHQVTLPTGAEARLGRQLETVTAELERSVSPMLASELRRLTGHDGTVPLTLAELRVDYAGVLGWTGGLVIAMLDQLATAPARPADQSTAPSSLPVRVVTGSGDGARMALAPGGIDARLAAQGRLAAATGSSGSRRVWTIPR
jgi:hypothetical protein